MRVARSIAVVAALLAATVLPQAFVGAQTPAATAPTSPSNDVSMQSPAFGMPGVPRFDAYALPANLADATNSGEPSIGIPWNTNHVFFQAFSHTHRAAFDDNKTGKDGVPAVSWDDTSPRFTPLNIDPILYGDHQTGRVWAGGLAGPCALMGYTDDDGANWLPVGNACTGAQFDHESIGAGPWPVEGLAPPHTYEAAVYYCSQGDRPETGFGFLPVGQSKHGAVCTVSADGGSSWLPFMQVEGGCGLFHGHIKVSPKGLAALPFADCGGVTGFGYSTDGGISWQSAKIPGSTPGQVMGFDPSLDFSHSGWMYYAQGDEQGLYVGLTKDGGKTWETLAKNTPGAAPGMWANLTAAYTDPDTGLHLKYANFVDVAAGDDDRAAIVFQGTTDPAGQFPFGDATGTTDSAACPSDSDPNVWHYYLAQTFDAGQTWTIERILDDPVQVGAVWDQGGSPGCRNLLDFADMQIDSHGRIVVGFADGCLTACATKVHAHMAGSGDAPTGSDSRAQRGTILRQTTGRGVFATADRPGPATVAPAPTTTAAPTPGLGPVILVLSLAGAVLLTRRRA